MIKKLSQCGNSKALILDKPILKLLNIDENTKLEISTDGNSLIITPIKSKLKKTKKIITDKKMQKLVDKNIKKYSPVFKKLSKN